MSADLVRHIENNRGKVGISVVLIISILVLTGVFVFTRNNAVNAAAITLASDTLNNSAPSATSTHTIQFTTPTGVAANATITVTFPSGFAAGSVDFTDIDIEADASSVAVADVSTGGVWGATTSGDIVLTLTNGTTAEAAGTVIEIQIGDNADSGNANFTNPAESAGGGVADIYTISVAGSFADTGDMLVAIVAGIAVSVTVDESLTFSIAGQSAAQCADYSNTSTSTEITTTATSVPFGTPTANDFTDGCQALTVSTNASSGYVVTVQENDQLTSGANQIPDGTCDGSCTDTAEAGWATLTNNGFAYCMEDVTGNGAATADTGWGTDGCDATLTLFKTIADEGASETPQNIMQSLSTISSDVADIGYRLNVPGDQEAGTYTNTLTFIATPTF